MPDPADKPDNLCGAKTRSGGTCRRYKVAGRTRCRQHGGASLIGPASGTWKNGRHSKWSGMVPDGALAERLQRAESDPTLLSLRSDVVLLEARLQQAAPRSGGGMTIKCTCGHEFDPHSAEPLRHRLVVGDSTKGDDVCRAVAGVPVDLVFTSPPYNCDIAYDEHDDKQSSDDYLRFIEAIVSVAVDHIGSGRFVCWNVGVTPQSRHFDHAMILRTAGLEFYRQIVWAKAGVAFPIWQNTERDGSARNYRPNYCHEVVYMFSKGEPERGGPGNVDAEYSRDVWHVHQSAASRDLPGETNGRKQRNERHGGSKAAAHPAAFPIGLPSGAIKHLTAMGEVVLDVFSGSGTTIAAADALGRVGCGVEMSVNYVAVSLDRFRRLGCQIEVVP